MTAGIPPEQSTAQPKELCEIIRRRRDKAVRLCTRGSLDGLGDTIFDKRRKYIDDAKRTGLAFSGGGIRSATISLGLTEALAVYGRFYAFDMMSTVSGGGYFGSFLRSLYIGRTEDDGIIKRDREKKAGWTKNRQKMADAVLLSVPDTQYFRADRGSDFLEPDVTIKNPLWWLRENGRYLAPDGASDYGFAIVYAVRNWLTLAFALIVALVCCFSLVQVSIMAGASRFPEILVLAQGSPPVSPSFALMAPLLSIAGGIGLGYWTSLGMSPQGGDDRQGETFIGRNWGFGVIIAALSAVALYLYCNRSSGDFALIADTGALIMGSAVISSLLVAIWSYRKGAARNKIAFEFRRNQTRLLSNYMAAMLLLFALCVVDSVALYVVGDGKIAKAAASSTVVATAFAWLIAKIPGWLEGKKSKFIELCRKNAPLAALIAGLAIAFGLAVIADLLVHKILWDGAVWSGAKPEIDSFRLFFAGAAILMALIGSSSQLLNLLAFTPLYTSRLTRSYLGASNASRQNQSDTVHSDVTKGMKGDDIDIEPYMKADIAAPLHLINVTLNRTLGSKQHPPPVPVGQDDPLLANSTAERPRGRIASYESQLTLRDRKGDRMVIGPEGIRAGAEWMGWNSLKGVELPSVGQFCGISGAAVSSGMGRHTSLGMAMALTLANVRLGYWWRRSVRAPDFIGRWAERFMESYRNLTSELLARYSRDSADWYLSDGGHSENTGVLSLLERGCEFVLVSDNGEDADYQFADLEILVRTARTDLGIEIDVVPPEEFPASLGNVKTLFFNDDKHNWRKQAKSREGAAFALLLKAKFIRSVKPDGSLEEDSPHCWIMWIKPSLFKGLPADLSTYAELNPDFPQQSTTNQFFGEAQWESYRRLGFAMGRALFDDKETLSDLLPVIRHKIPRFKPQPFTPPA